MKKFNYSVVIYQKHDSTKPHFIASNQGDENGACYRFIVDYYHDFPDVAMFVHAKPQEHQSERWPRSEIWVEQCWRDALKIVWDLKNNTAALNKRVPPTKPMLVCIYASQRFIISRAMVHRRPLSVWKELLHTLGESKVCHEGEPDYESLYAY